MRVLGIDTSDRIESFTLIENDIVRGEWRGEVKTHSTVLLPTLIEFLEKYDLTFSDIDGWGIAIGPGSFTGLRIGLATILGITFEREIPVVGVITLQAMAIIAGVNGFVSPAIDARKKEIYTGLYRVDNSGLEVIEVERAVSPGEWKTILLKREGNVSILGSGVEKYKEVFIDDKVEILNVDVPVSRGVALIANNQIKGGYKGKPTEPFYIRKSEAEINFEKKKLKID